MNDTPLRGMKIGATSYEVDHYVEPAERIMVRYDCPAGHQTVLPFSVEAEEIPRTWGCRCGRDAEIVTRTPRLAAIDDRPERHQRTHWDMLRERRSIPELEVLLAERLALLHPEKQARKSA